MPRYFASVILFVWFVLAPVCSLPVVAHADAPAPSLALPTDPDPPHVSLVAAVDFVGLVMGQYGPRFGVALGAVQSVWVSPTVQRRSGRRGLAGEVGYALHPMARGLTGLHVGLFAGAVYLPGQPPMRAARLGAELGYMHLWGRVMLGVSGGAAHTWTNEPTAGRPWSPVIRAQLGHAFM